MFGGYNLGLRLKHFTKISASVVLLWLAYAAVAGKGRGVAQHPLQLEVGKKHVSVVGKNQGVRAGTVLGDVSRVSSLSWIFGVGFEVWLSVCLWLAWRAFKKIENCIS